MISPHYVQGNIPLIASILTGKTAANEVETDFSENREALRPFAMFGAGPAMGRGKTSISEAPKGSIAVISVNGPMMKEDQFCGPQGTATLSKYIQEADQNPNIEAIVLSIDSPGGTVDGTETFSRIIAETKKPVVAYIDGCMCSAALWAGSSADEIIASGETDIIGSIGTMISLVNTRPMFEDMGISFHDILATKSNNKNKEFLELLEKGNEKLIQKNHLDPLNEVFIAAVKTNRKGKVDPDHQEVFTGKTYHSKAAIKMGLIDRIGSFEMAVDRAHELAISQTHSPSTSLTKNKTDMKISIKSTFTALIAALGLTFDAKESESMEHEMTPEQLEGINTKLEKIDSLETTVEDQDKEITRIQTALTKAEKDLVTANENITTLSKNPKEESTALPKDGDDKISSADPKPKTSWEEKMDRKQKAQA
jgi:protease IV